MHPEDIARVVHEANRAIQIVQADPSIPVALPWDEWDYESKQSVLEGVYGVLAGNTPEQSHAGWMEFKERNGWRLGDVKDDEKKTHPLMVPYAELSAEAKLKDRLFIAIVNALKANQPLEFVQMVPAPENN